MRDHSSYPHHVAACEALVYNLLQRCKPRTGMIGIAVAVVAAHPEAGVSSIVRMLQETLNENAPGSTLTIDCSALGYPRDSNLTVGERFEARGGHWGSSLMIGRYRARAEHLNGLRTCFPYVLVDCCSLKQKTDVLALAPLVDGVILVVEGDRTTKGQLGHMERAVTECGGTILGSVLNKRSYPIPRGLHSLMTRIGL